MLDSKLDSKLEKMLEKKLGFPVDQTPITSSIMRLVRQCNARSVTVVTSILMHIKRRKNKFKVDLVNFFISMLESMLELKLEVR